ncbi:hypothetical protein [Mesorhizobium australicum]|uniref:hypothetical protein n=1 Tax=Mesorhizobium australicum TaxID=536018 RepID=UPI003336CF02
MASIVVYKMVQGAEDRFQGMKEAGDRIASATQNPNNDADVILIKTLDDLITEKDSTGLALYKVKYTHSDGKEYDLEIDTNNGNPPSGGKYRYNVHGNYIKLKIEAKRDKADSNGNENMRLTAPRDAVVLANGSYLDKVITDVGGVVTDDVRKYLFGTIMLRRCR